MHGLGLCSSSMNGELKWEMEPISFDHAYGLSWILLNNLLRMMNKKMDNNA